jgi:hypothetical protein
VQTFNFSRHINNQTKTQTKIVSQKLSENEPLMEQHVFVFSFIIEGTTKKVLQFLMSIYNKNLSFIEQKMYF